MDKPDSAAPRLNARCSCYTGCGDDALSSQPHQHADDPCPAHPNAPMHAAAAPRQPEGPQDLSDEEIAGIKLHISGKCSCPHTIVCLSQAVAAMPRVLAELARRRAQPADAADALRAELVRNYKLLKAAQEDGCAWPASRSGCKSGEDCNCLPMRRMVTQARAVIRRSGRHD